MSIETTAYFENIHFHLRRELLNAKESIKVCVAWINWDIYNSVWEKLVNKGIEIEIIYNYDDTNRRNFRTLPENVHAYPVYNVHSNSLMHNKFCIIDNKTVITGSFNWSQKAFWHFENIVVIKNDFKLVKQFLHEFEDLKYYGSIHEYNVLSLPKCVTCRARTYNLAILGEESGTYSSSVVDIYNICWKNNHAAFIQSIDAQFLKTYLGYINTPDFIYDGEYDKFVMLDEFNFERNRIEKSDSYFNHDSDLKIDAIGSVVIQNFNEHIKYNEDPDYIIAINWKDMYKRKIIPDFLGNGDSDSIDEIIDQHY